MSLGLGDSTRATELRCSGPGPSGSCPVLESTVCLSGGSPGLAGPEMPLHALGCEMWGWERRLVLGRGSGLHLF